MEKLDTDIVFAGSSTVYSGVDPMILWKEKGYTSYLRSNASQTTWISYYMIEDAIRYNKPELVILDVGFAKYDDGFVEEPSNRKSIDGMRWSSSKLNCIEASKGEDEKLMDYIFPVFRFHTRWKDFRAEDLKYLLYSKPVSHNGYIPDYIETGELPEYHGYDHGDEVSISGKNREYLIKTMELCRDNDIQLLLMKVPSYSDNWSFAYDREVEEMAEPYGYKYINFDSLYKEIGLDYSTDSPDEGSHLNSNGAELFTSYLGDYIEEHYKVSSHKGDPAYEKVWDKKLKWYEEDKEIKKKEALEGRLDDGQ